MPLRRRLWLGFQDLLGTRDPRDRANALIELPGHFQEVVSFLPTVDAQVELAARLCPAS